MTIQEALARLREVPGLLYATTDSVNVKSIAGWEALVAEYAPHQVGLYASSRGMVLVFARKTAIGEVTLSVTPEEYAEWVGVPVEVER